MMTEIDSTQAGFRKGRGCRDHICNLRWILEKAEERQQEINLCFIDYSKAFDSVDHNTLWNNLRQIGIPEHLIHLMKELYKNQIAVIRTEWGDTEEFNVERGVRQGCILSPYLFNMYSEIIMRNALDNTIGFNIGGNMINNLRYADDTTLIAANKNDLEKLIKSIKDKSEEAGLYLNVKKTKVMSNKHELNITVDGQQIEQVTNFTFLGSRLEADGSCLSEIRRRITLGRSALTRMTKIWQCRDVGVEMKRRLVETLVFSIVKYGSESWTLKKEDRRRIDGFELWCWRRALRISWMKKVTNVQVLQRMGVTSSLEATMMKQRLGYLGHILRADSMEKSLLLGMVEGNRRRGRPRVQWMDEVKKATGMSVQMLKEMALDRCSWRRMTHDVTMNRKRIDGT